MKNYFSVVLAGAFVLVTGAMVTLQPGNAADPACKLYKVTAPILDLRKDPGKPGGYLDVLEGGNIACVTEEKNVGNRKWGYVAHQVQEGGKQKKMNGWVGLRFMALQAAPATPSKPATPVPSAAATKPAAAPTAPATPSQPTSAGLKFDEPVPFGPYPVRGSTLKQLAKGSPFFSPVEGLPDELWKKTCSNCHKWNQERLCAQGASYIKAAKQVFRHQHPYGGTYKLALMRWAKTGCK